MVDSLGAISFSRNAHVAHRSESRASPAMDVRCAVRPCDAQALLDYERLCDASDVAPPQSPEWTRAWTEQNAPEVIVASLRMGSDTVLAMPLEIVRQGAWTVARFVGGRHANGNFAAVRRGWAGHIGGAELQALRREIAAARPDIDMLSLERQARSIGVSENPFLRMPHEASPNIALAVDLNGGFDALLDRSSGKRKRKKHRSQTRKFEAAGGGFRRFAASTPQETDAVLDRFFVMKAERFAKMGIADVFAGDGVRGAFRQLFAGAAGAARPQFVLHALEVDGTIRAITGSSVCGDRLICEFGAIAEDELAGASPGDFLFFDNIHEACDQGFAIYDFSVGDEPYKRLWCDIEFEQFDCFVPLTAKGHVLAASKRQSARLKRFVKNNRTIWRAVKALRQSRAPKAPAPGKDD